MQVKAAQQDLWGGSENTSAHVTTQKMRNLCLQSKTTVDIHEKLTKKNYTSHTPPPSITIKNIHTKITKREPTAARELPSEKRAGAARDTASSGGQRGEARAARSAAGARTHEVRAALPQINSFAQPFSQKLRYFPSFQANGPNSHKEADTPGLSELRECGCWNEASTPGRKIAGTTYIHTHTHYPGRS